MVRLMKIIEKLIISKSTVPFSPVISQVCCGKNSSSFNYSVETILLEY